MFDQPSSGLHQPLLQTRQRPVLDPSGQCQPSPQIAQIVGQQAQRQAGGTPSELNASRFCGCAMPRVPSREEWGAFDFSPRRPQARTIALCVSPCHATNGEISDAEPGDICWGEPRA